MSRSKKDTEFINRMISEVDNLHPAPLATPTPSSHIEDEILELGEHFDFNGFQVVRREFFAHIYEPSISFNNCKFYVNNACLQRFPGTDYVQVLVNKDTKILAIMPCPENARDSFAWCSFSRGKRTPKQITAKLVFSKVAAMMDWNPDYRYKILGKQIHANGEYLIAFDLTATEIYQRSFPEGAKPKTSRIPIFPAEWQNQFGLPYNEHKQSLQINVLDGYVTYSIKDDTKKESEDNSIAAPNDNTPSLDEEPANNK